jgi:Spy/CpxP family protein refolding chaperone
MNRPNIITIAISILIINMAILTFLFFSHSRPGPRRGMQHHEKNENGAPHHMVHGRKNFGMRDHFKPRVMDELHLSDAQKEKMDQLRKVQQEQTARLMQKIREIRNRESGLIKTGKLDNAQMNALAAEFGQYQKELHLLKLNHLKAMHATLTPEQQEKFLKELNENVKDKKRTGEFQQ